MKNRKIIIGSRGSKLALIYAEKAREKILKHSKDFECLRIFSLAFSA